MFYRTDGYKVDAIHCRRCGMKIRVGGLMQMLPAWLLRSGRPATVPYTPCVGGEACEERRRRRLADVMSSVRHVVSGQTCHALLITSDTTPEQLARIPDTQAWEWGTCDRLLVAHGAYERDFEFGQWMVIDWDDEMLPPMDDIEFTDTYVFIYI